jgi:hypothetical protein
MRRKLLFHILQTGVELWVVDIGKATQLTKDMLMTLENRLAGIATTKIF